MKPGNLDKFGSHIPILIKILEKTHGKILELGTGPSSYVIHALCRQTGRTVVTYESNKQAYEAMLPYQSDFHQIYFVEDWDKIDLEHDFWDVAVVDHSPDRRRPTEVKRLALRANYVLLHDSDIFRQLYIGSGIYSLFKYRYDYTKTFPNTVIFSNFRDFSILYNSHFSFFHTRGGSGYIRGHQMAEYFGAKENPTYGYENDLCIYVKILPPENHPKHSYLDVDDSPQAAEYLKTHPEMGVIAISETAKDYLQNLLHRKDVVFIPHQHCNFERWVRPDRPVKTVGIIGTTGSFQYPIDDFRKKLEKIGLELKYEVDYWRTYMGTLEREMRLNICDFHKTIDLQVVYRPQYKYRLEAPFKNPNKLGNASAFGIPTVSLPEASYVREWKGCFVEVKSIDEMILKLKKLKNDQKFYKKIAAKALARSEDYHIDSVAKLYLNLK